MLSLHGVNRQILVHHVLTNHITICVLLQKPEQHEVTEGDVVLTVIQEITSVSVRPRDELSRVNINIHEYKVSSAEEVT